MAARPPRRRSGRERACPGGRAGRSRGPSPGARSRCPRARQRSTSPRGVLQPCVLHGPPGPAEAGIPASPGPPGTFVRSGARATSVSGRLPCVGGSGSSAVRSSSAAPGARWRTTRRSPRGRRWPRRRSAGGTFPVEDLVLGPIDALPDRLPWIVPPEDTNDDERPMFGGEAEEAVLPFGSGPELVDLVKSGVGAPDAWTREGTWVAAVDGRALLDPTDARRPRRDGARFLAGLQADTHAASRSTSWPWPAMPRASRRRTVGRWTSRRRSPRAASSPSTSRARTGASSSAWWGAAAASARSCRATRR